MPAPDDTVLETLGYTNQLVTEHRDLIKEHRDFFEYLCRCAMLDPQKDMETFLLRLARAATAEYMDLVANEPPTTLGNARDRRALHIATHVFPGTWPSKEFIAAFLGLTDSQAVAMLNRVRARSRETLVRESIDLEVLQALREALAHSQGTQDSRVIPYVLTIDSRQATQLNDVIRRRDPGVAAIEKSHQKGVGLYDLEPQGMYLLMAKYALAHADTPPTFLRVLRDNASTGHRDSEAAIRVQDVRNAVGQGTLQVEKRLRELWAHGQSVAGRVKQEHAESALLVAPNLLKRKKAPSRAAKNPDVIYVDITSFRALAEDLYVNVAEDWPGT